MRSKVALTIGVMGFCSMIGCKAKPSLSTEDTRYVRTTIGLMRLRSELRPPVDSTDLARRLDSVYRVFSTSKQAYLNETSQLGTNVPRAAAVYAAIKDSLGIK